MTHLSNKVKYVKSSFVGKPSFLIVIDKIEYISNGCVFVENTQSNIDELIKKYDCKKYLDELLSSEWKDFSVITDATSMFWNCTSLTSFDSDISNVSNARSMFWNCMFSILNCNDFVEDTSLILT